MLREQLHTTDFSVVTRMYDAVERGDMDALRGCFVPDARVWHNDDEIELDIDAVVALIGHLCAVSTSRAYQDRRLTTVGTQAFLQHTLTAALRSGRRLRLPAIMRVEVNRDGLLQRMEEYFDSRALACLAEEVP